MQKIIEKWNEKWKTQRLQLLLSGFGEKEKNFFENLEIVKVTRVEYMDEDEDAEFTLEYIIHILHEDTSYYIGKEYNSFYISYNESMDYLQFWSTFFNVEQHWRENFNEMNKKRNIYNRQINDFLNVFQFEEIITEIEQDATRKQLEIDHQTHTGIKSIGVEYNEKDGQYYMVFDNGMKVPYKKEKRHVTELYYN